MDKDNDLKTTFHHDDDKFHVKYEYDAEPIIEQNKVERNDFRTYKDIEMQSGLVKVASLHAGDVERLAALGYNIMSPDKDEWRRALRYIQEEQQALMTVTGKPFAKINKKWL